MEVCSITYAQLYYTVLLMELYSITFGTMQYYLCNCAVLLMELCSITYGPTYYTVLLMDYD